EELWAVAADRMLGLDQAADRDAPLADPAMVRLREMADAAGKLRPALAVVGEPGVGRETLLRRLRATAAPRAPIIVYRAARLDPRHWQDDTPRAAGGALHVRYPTVLPDAELAAFFSSTRFLPSASFPLGKQPPREVAAQIFVPSLTSRPADVPVIAEYVLNR